MLDAAAKWFGPVDFRFGVCDLFEVCLRSSMMQWMCCYSVDLVLGCKLIE